VTDGGDRIIVVDAGRIIEDAPPLELFSTAHDERTKSVSLDRRLT
jgi:polar amino acid transport system ATP-binding protein